MLRSLVEVDPTCVGGLISYAVTTLHALRESVAMEKVSLLECPINDIGIVTKLFSVYFCYNCFYFL